MHFGASIDRSLALWSHRPEQYSSAGAPAAWKPAIAVLPFVSSAGDSDYFADGMTDGRFSCLTVMSRNAVTSYKGLSPLVALTTRCAMSSLVQDRITPQVVGDLAVKVTQVEWTT